MVLGRLFKLEKGVEKTRSGFFGRMAELFGRARIDDDLWDELEEILLAADVGVPTTEQVMANLRRRVSIGAVTSPSELRRAIQEELVDILDLAPPTEEPLVSGPLTVVLVVGVNGVGKTTTIAKLSKLLKDQGHAVVLAAADTFRAAAIDQLKIWGERAGVQVVSHQPGADPGSVTFDAIAAAKARGADVVIVDTAGRLHTKVNLMEELRKIRRVIEKQQVPRVQTLLVLDATIGQNGLMQAKTFAGSTGIDGLVVAKLDGTARGGVVFSIVHDLRVPIRFVGTGEKLDDLAEFDPEEFVEALFAAPQRR